MEPYTQTCYYLSTMQPISKMFGTAVSRDFQVKKFPQVCRWYFNMWRKWRNQSITDKKHKNRSLCA